jgi:hypothetical protein
MKATCRFALPLCASMVALLSAVAGCATPVASSETARPAAQAAPATQRTMLVNPGFESDKPGDHSDVEGWYMYQHAGEPSYAFVLDATSKRGGTRSMRIDNIGSQPYGSIAQVLPGAAFAGKTIRFSGWLRAKGVTGDGAYLFVIAERGGAIAAHDFMGGKEVKGDLDWALYTVTLAIPPFTDLLRVGATLQGPGSVWFDDVSIEIVAAR